ncbi:alanine:cation symporter family protein [Nannocystis bainbridge]|uniref:Alanine:cation symporter family protein n=1 Tax=Nannocystis bainbridge TaxID=2995303 RepID=A0ABT5DVJ3_9BACT|nr:alanine:cation symporter family protein [Nannocystis bainbridge]MDC0717170.1 alanine:cation symporter family protein [Nannocystis bainbridge]
MFDPTSGLLALLVAVFASAGLLVAVFGRAPQLRGLAQALRPSRARRRLFAGAGLGAIVGAAFALAAGGPGAIAWWWLAGLLGGGLHWAEARLGAAERVDDMSRGSGRFGHVLKFMSACAGLAAALAAGGLLLAQQGAEVLRDSLGLAPWAAGPVLAGLLLALALLARRRPGGDDLAGLGALAGFALLAWTGVALAALLAAPGALAAGLSAMVEGAWSGEAALAGALAAAGQAVLWSSFAAGIGGAADGDPSEPAERVVGVAPITAAVATLAGLLVLAGGDPRAPIVAAEASALPGAPAGTVALERYIGVGLQPSDYGQTVVLAGDLGLTPGKRYEVVLRADPRGHRAGEVIAGDNLVVVPTYAVAADVDSVILRDKDPARAGNPGFDVHIACTRERVKTRVGEFYKLRPRDPNINLFQLMRARDLDGPYVRLRDYHFVASVRPAVALGSNETRHLLYEEPRPDDAPADPTLRELITLGFAGPYLDPGGATEAPPFALAAAPGAALTLDQRVHLRLDAPVRGLELGFVNRLGELEVPPWDLLAGVTDAVLPHRDDPGLDVHVPVRSRLAFGRLRFTSADPAIVFAELSKSHPDHGAPRLVPPSHRFAAEVRASTRVPAPRPDGPVLIPLHRDLHPTGNPGYSLYTPHPAELLLAGMQAPVRDQFGAAQVLPGLRAGLGRAGDIAGGLVLGVLTLAGLMFWLRRGQRFAAGCFGGGEFGVALVFLVCVFAGPACDPAALLRLAVPALALAAVLGLTVILTRLQRLRGP